MAIEIGPHEIRAGSSRAGEPIDGAAEATTSLFRTELPPYRLEVV